MFISRRLPLVTEAAAYADTELIGGMQSFQMRTPGGAGKLTRYMLKSLSSVGVNSVVYFFDAEPSEDTAFTENGVFNVHANDRSKLIHVLEIGSGDWKNYSARAGVYVAEKTLAVPFNFTESADATGRHIIAAWVLSGAHTPGSTADVEAMIGAEVD